MAEFTDVRPGVTLAQERKPGPELRLLAVELRKAGTPVQEIAGRLGVGRQSVYRWVELYEQAGESGLTAKPRRRRRSARISAEIEKRICLLRQNHPDWGAVRIIRALADEGVSPLPAKTTVYRVLARHRLTTPGPPPNERLRWEREQRGWTRAELVRQLAESVRQAGEPPTALTPDDVYRWETGRRRAGRTYRKHLVRVFEKPAAELGLLPATDFAVRQAPEIQTRLPALGETITEAAEIIGSRARAADPRTAAAFTTMTAALRAEYWTRPARDLLADAWPHTRKGWDRLRESGGESAAERELAGATAESALLCARLSFFDLHRPMDALKAFAVAENAVSIARDNALAAAIATHQAYVPGFAGDADGAAAFLTPANIHARAAGSLRLRSWVYCVTAEIGSRTGDPRCRDKIRRAEDVFASGTNDPVPVWLDYFGEDRLAGFAGGVDLRMRKWDSATRHLERALAGLSGHQVKQRPVALFDLARATAPAEPERAVQLAHEAIDLFEGGLHYANALVDRIPAVLASLRGTPACRELTDRVNSLRDAY